MNDKKKSKSASPKTKRVSKPRIADESGKKPVTKTRKVSATSKTAIAKNSKTKAVTVAAPAPAAKRAPKTRKATSKTKEPAAKTRTRKAPAAAGIPPGEPVEGVAEDVSSGEAINEAGPVAQAVTAGEDKVAATAELTAAEGEAGEEETAGGVVSGEDAEGETEPPAEPAPENLERLQKILSQAGIASRRHAEEMIVAGRVMVNGKVVTQLGSKADPARDHIRVDGKLLHGAERHRYFVLNKPKGYVTTVSDPEGRQTVMEFFAKMPERLYPVGRLDYQSEGLLLVTNDGELANLLTKAGSGVEKTYLVKVSGQPSEEELERLRSGVTIEREGEGSERVRSAPARIREVREGDNPWYEVVLIEGRNRELRKMFSAVGHFVEKIRRVGYGPLVLDVEPGKLRELTLEEVRDLRLTAEGKLKPKRLKVERQPPAQARRAPEKPSAREDRPRRHDNRPTKTEERPRQGEFRGRKEEEIRTGEGPSNEFRRGEFRGGAKEVSDRRRGAQFDAKPGRPDARPRFDRPRSGGSFPGAKPGERPAFGAERNLDAKPRFPRPAGKPGRFGKDSRPESGAERAFRGERPGFAARPRPEQPQFDRPHSGPKPRFERPAFPRRQQGEQAGPRFERPAIGSRPRNESSKPRSDAAKHRPFRAPGERPPFPRNEAPNRQFERPRAESVGARPAKPWTEKPRTGPFRPGKDAPRGRFDSRAGAKRSGSSKGRSFSSKGPGFRGKHASGRGSRPPGKPGGGMRRG